MIFVAPEPLLKSSESWRGKDGRLFILLYCYTMLFWIIGYNFALLL